MQFEISRNGNFCIHSIPDIASGLGAYYIDWIAVLKELRHIISFSKEFFVKVCHLLSDRFVFVFLSTNNKILEGKLPPYAYDF